MLLLGQDRLYDNQGPRVYSTDLKLKKKKTKQKQQQQQKKN